MDNTAIQQTNSLRFSHGFQAHWQSVYPYVLRALRAIYRPFVGEFHSLIGTNDQLIPMRIWIHKQPSTAQKDLFILSHGLEGSAESGYIQETAEVLYEQGYDVWAWYMRGCSPIDTGPILYHSGFTHDLKDIVEEAKKLNYRRIHLIGFSAGGNITLKLLGEGMKGIASAVCFSTPLKLEDVSHHLSKSFYGFYMKRFLKTLKEKIRIKNLKYPESAYNTSKLETCKDFEEFDAYFTAPMHGFSSAHDFYSKSSSYFYLENISSSCLVVNACNDPFLTPSCFPDPLQFPHIHFQYPLEGGHCGFNLKGKSMASIALEFIAQ